MPIAELPPARDPTIEAAKASSTQGTDDAPGEALPWKEATQRFQASLLRKALAECDGSVSQVARRLDLARSAVYVMIDRFGIDDHRGPSNAPPESED